MKKKTIENVDPHNINYYIKSSQQKLQAGDVDGALVDAEWALRKNPAAINANLQKSDCVYEQNEFEHNIVDVSQKSKQYVGHRSRVFAQREQTAVLNLDDALGKIAGHCLVDQEDMVMKIYREGITNAKAERPLWKTMRENRLCDVISELQIKEKELSRKAAARSDQNWKVFTQTYVPRGWEDIAFLKQLKTNPLLNLSQTEMSNVIMNDAVSHGYDKVMESIEKLHARCPLYAQKLKRFGNKETAKVFKEKHLFRIQVGTRRDIFNQLDHLKELRRMGQMEKLVRYAEEVLGQYYEVKTLRVMPRKMEFVNEICNIVALAYADSLRIPDDLYRNFEQHELIGHLFNIHATTKDTDDIVVYKFGEKSTFRDPTHVDLSYLKQKNHLTKLDKMIQNSKCPAEQAFLYNRIAEIQLQQNKLEETRVFADKVVEKAKIAKNHLWHLLGIIMICKTYILQNKVEKLRPQLFNALELLPKLSKTRDKLFQLIEMAIEINKDDINAKK